jgi:hypothetical protein
LKQVKKQKEKFNSKAEEDNTRKWANLDKGMSKQEE